MLSRVFEVESSQFSPRAYWVNGGEYFAERVTVEYPAELDELSDEQLSELADEESQGVRYVESADG
jgi:hypothetical protein